MLSSSLKDLLKNLIDNELNKTFWKITDEYSNMRRLTIDQRGRVGEHFFKIIFEELNLLQKYIDNSHGDWDIEAGGYKIEIKTATLDVNEKFQHEGIKENKLWDVVAFLDIAPNAFYITFIYKDEFCFGIENKLKNNKYGTVKINNKIQKIHYRGKDTTGERATGAGYKVDLKLFNLKECKTLKDIENAFNDMKFRNNLK